MSKPYLVCDLTKTLETCYNDTQLKELDSVLEGIGVDRKLMKHREIIPAKYISNAAKKLSLGMAGLAVLPWHLKVDEQAVIKSCFARVNIFGSWYYLPASYYRPAEVEVYITANGVKTGGVMAG